MKQSQYIMDQYKGLLQAYSNAHDTIAAWKIVATSSIVLNVLLIIWGISE